MTGEYESDHEDHDDGGAVWSFIQAQGHLDCLGWSLQAGDSGLVLTCACGRVWAFAFDDAEPVATHFASLLLRQRKALNWSVREVAGRTGLAVSAVSSAERGLRDIRLSSAVKLADVLDIELCDLVSEAGGLRPCRACGNCPPAGFTCNACGRGESR